MTIYDDLTVELSIKTNTSLANIFLIHFQNWTSTELIAFMYVLQWVNGCGSNVFSSLLRCKLECVLGEGLPWTHTGLDIGCERDEKLDVPKKIHVLIKYYFVSLIIQFWATILCFIKYNFCSKFAIFAPITRLRPL